jgi:TP901 family phage tail tape measure protein
MGESVSVLSKSMGGDATAAAETLTTAMNQYGVSLDDPIKAARDMADMMNVMAAAAGVGSAELPQIKQALEQTGMSAKAAGVSFEETNAAIQVLDKAGKKGSEGGIALRNVMTTLAKGRFLPKDVQEELSAAGVSVQTLTDKWKLIRNRTYWRLLNWKYKSKT